MVSINTALSGIAANERRLEIAAENAANASTENYRAKDVAQETRADGSVAVRVVERDPATAGDRPNVSLEEELIQVQFATYGAQANIKVLKAQDKLDKYLLDIQA